MRKKTQVFRQCADSQRTIQPFKGHCHEHCKQLRRECRHIRSARKRRRCCSDQSAEKSPGCPGIHRCDVDPIIAATTCTGHIWHGGHEAQRRRLTPHADGLSGGTRTPDLLLRRQLLYPVELRTAKRGVYRALAAKTGRQRVNLKALSKTLTELMAMAAPASMGLSPPMAASGMPTTL